MFNAYLTATKYSLLEQARNRFAIGLLLIFTPLWFFMIGQLIPSATVAFKLMGTGALLQVNGHALTVLTAGFNALTLIIGFTMFHSTLKGARFDHRLTLSGYQQPTLMLAKVTALVVVAIAISLYSALVLLAFWRPTEFGLVWLGYFCSALTYGALGLLLGTLINSELAGFFIVIMVSLMDTFLQAPVENPVANKSWLAAFPTYGSMQVAVSGGFTHTVAWSSIGVSLLWFIGFTLLGMLIFWLRTRAWNARGRVAGRVQPQLRAARGKLDVDYDVDYQEEKRPLASVGASVWAGRSPADQRTRP